MGAPLLPGQSFEGLEFTPANDWLLNHDTAEFRSVEIDVDIDDGDGEDIVKSGLVLGKITTGGKYKEYDNSANDGRETAVAILLHPVYKKDVFGQDIVSPAFAGVVVRGRVDGTKLIGIDSNGRVELKAAGFLFDDTL